MSRNATLEWSPAALLKASSIILMADDANVKVSARNRVAGRVTAFNKGAVNSEVVVTSDTGTQIVAIITNESADRLGLLNGAPATAIFKATPYAPPSASIARTSLLVRQGHAKEYIEYMVMKGWDARPNLNIVVYTQRDRLSGR